MKLALSLIVTGCPLMIAGDNILSQAEAELKQAASESQLVRHYQPSPDEIVIVHVIEQDAITGHQTNIETLAVTYGGSLSLDEAARRIMTGEVKPIHDVWSI